MWADLHSSFFARRVYLSGCLFSPELLIVLDSPRSGLMVSSPGVICRKPDTSYSDLGETHFQT